MQAAAQAADQAEAKKGKKRPKAKARLSDLETQSVHAVAAGANMRNKPLIVKADDVELAVWATAYVNDLPDSAFLYIAPGGEKDADGKTVPRSLRYFPIRDQNGGLDLPHLRNAIARIPQSTASGLTEDKKTQLQERARRMLEEAQKEEEEMADGAEAAQTDGKQEPGETDGLELSTAQKELLLTGLTDTIEKLTGLAEAVGAAVVNEEATVPEEVLLVIQGCSEQMAGLVQQVSPPAPPPPAEPPAETPPPAETEMAAAKSGAKISTAGIVVDGQALADVLAAAGAEPTEKAGAMLSRKNRGLVQAALDALSKLLEAADKEKAEKSDGPAEPPDPEPTVAQQIDDALRPHLARFEEHATAIAKAVQVRDAAAAAKDEQIAKLAAQANAPAPSNSADPDVTTSDYTSVPHDLSAAAKAATTEN